MKMSEERMKILEMVANGTLSPEEAARLLEAVESSEPKQDVWHTEATGKTPRWLRIRVTDLDTGASRVNIRVPWFLVKFGLKLGGRISVGGLGDKGMAEEVTRALEEALASGEQGKIIDVEDKEERERVEIFLE